MKSLHKIIMKKLSIDKKYLFFTVFSSFLFPIIIATVESIGFGLVLFFLFTCSITFEASYYVKYDDDFIYYRRFVGQVKIAWQDLHRLQKNSWSDDAIYYYKSDKNGQNKLKKMTLSFFCKKKEVQEFLIKVEEAIKNNSVTIF